MIALIINFNRLTLPKNMADWLVKRGCEPVFVDNNSDYPPLLEYYYKCPYKVVRLNQNFGHTVIWGAGILDELNIHEQHIITDPDLDLSGVPDDFLEVLKEGLARYPDYHKCGLSLEINDLPDTPAGNMVRNGFEAPYWVKKIDERYIEADIDTTLAVCRPEIRTHTTSAIRTDRPYTARHLPWYYDHINDLPEDEQYYFKTCNGSSSGAVRIRR
jgi:hypothetical protein